MSLILTEFEKKILDNFRFSERDSRKFARSIDDIAATCGYSSLEVYEFLLYGAETEREELRQTYDWEKFKKQIVRKLKKRNES